MEHARVYDVRFSFFYKNSLDFLLNLIQSEGEVETIFILGFLALLFNSKIFNDKESLSR